MKAWLVNCMKRNLTSTRTLDRCDAILRPVLDGSLLDVLYPAEGIAGDSVVAGNGKLNDTLYTQTACLP